MTLRRDFAVLALLMMALTSNADAQSVKPFEPLIVFPSRELLNQNIADLQKSPNDLTLRCIIIRIAQKLSPPPAIPEEAERFEGRAEAAFKGAKAEADFLGAAQEYEKAALVAPWVSSYYFNLGVAYDKAGQPQDAIRNFQLYVFAVPSAADARDVRKRIAGLEYTIEKAGRMKEEATTVVPPSAKPVVATLAGDWYSVSSTGCPDWFHFRFDIRGDAIAAVTVQDRRVSSAPNAFRAGDERPHGTFRLSGEADIEGTLRDSDGWNRFWKGSVADNSKRIEGKQWQVARSDGTRIDGSFTWVRKEACHRFYSPQR